MSVNAHFNRSRGNLMPSALPKEPAGPCMKYKIDVDHYKRTGEIIPLTEPVEYIPDREYNPYLWVGQNENEMEEEDMPRGIDAINKPTKEQLAEDVKTMKNKEIAEKYGLAESTIARYVKEYGVQRRNLVEAEHNPTLAEIEQFHTDEPRQELPDISMTEPITIEPHTDDDMPIMFCGPDPEELGENELVKVITRFADPLPEPDPDERIWQSIQADILALKKRKLERAEREFQDRLLKLLECC